jgi:hypothetical protein
MLWQQQKSKCTPKTAQRKVRKETEGVWNAFFTTFRWDTVTDKGTRIANPSMVVEYNDIDENVKLGDTTVVKRSV